MSDFSESLSSRVETLLSTEWAERNGVVVPSSETVSLKDGAVKLDATFLYADLAGSSVLSDKCPWHTTAKIMRAYLACATRIIRNNNGYIRSFDGDRVMGVYVGNLKNTNAVKSAREIDWLVEKVLAPKASARFNSIKNNNIWIKHAVGVDTGITRAVRAGIRDNNDLIWIGSAPSFAAKLSDLREYPYAVFITKEVYDRMADSQKPSDGIWESRNYKDRSIYRTSRILRP